MKKRIAILGSTGSIGRNTLEVIAGFPDEFEVIGLSTNYNIGILNQQIKEFSPKLVAVANSLCADNLRKGLNNRVKLLIGEEGIEDIAKDKRIDLVVLAISGSAALLPLIRAIEAGKTIALANKEALVMAGPIIMQKAKAKKVKIIPIDSEQSAIWQCMEGKEKSILKKIYLTASGGPFKNIRKKEFKNISIKDVLNHPCWKMGKKVTVDSATLMNKGLELIETMCLFDVDISKICVVIHPQAIIHSMVEFIDGSLLAQLSMTDMRIPIQYALTYPKRLARRSPTLDFFKLKDLNFDKPDLERFPCLGLAYEAAKKKGTFPCVLNAANEVAVDAFLNKKIDFSSISKIIEKVMQRHKNAPHPDLDKVLSAHNWAKHEAEDLLNRLAS